MPSVRKLSDSFTYSSRYDGDGYTLYAVSGLSSNECVGPQATALGLPAQGAIHEGNPNLQVYERRLIEDLGVTGTGEWNTIVGVFYRPVNWAGAFRGRNATLESGSVQILLVPIVSISAYNSLGEAVVFNDRQVTPMTRPTFIRTESVVTGDSEADITAWFQRNIGRAITFQGSDYLILQPYLRRDSGNNKYLDIRLQTSNIVPAADPGRFEGQDIALPELPAMAEYRANMKANPPVIKTISPKELYGEAEPCPWL